MAKAVTLKTSAGEFELKLTMARVEIIQELTGIDMLSGDTEGLSAPRNVLKVLYALAGGEGSGVPYQQFTDSLTVAEFAAAAELVSEVVQRDSNVSASTKSGGKAGGAGNA